MIQEIKGNLFDSKAEAFVNTVNCIGISGKGIALEFKKRYPDNFKFYKRVCEERELKPGHIAIFKTKYHPKYIVNFATKDKWWNKSHISWIEMGLIDVRNLIENEPLSSVAMPLLGCSNGGLDIKDVKPLIYRYLDGLECKVELYER